jgi:hypothetical protein
MSFLYIDQRIEVEKAAQAAGVMPSAVRELLENVSAETIEGLWRHDNDGQPYFTRGKTQMNVDEYVAAIVKVKPHYLFAQGSEKDAADDLLDRCFGASPTLAARGEFVKLYGEGALAEQAKAWGCDYSLRPGVKPGTATDEKKNAGPHGGSTNPWSSTFAGSDEARAEKMSAIIRTGTRFAVEMAKACGTTIGRPLPRAKR